MTSISDTGTISPSTVVKGDFRSSIGPGDIDITPALPGGLRNPLDALVSLLDFLKWLTDPQHWKRIGIIILGGALLIAALYLAVKGF